MPSAALLVHHGAALAFFAPLAYASREIVACAFLDAAGRLLGTRFHLGEPTRVVLPIRTIATDALAFDARVLVMAHNHPSGDPRASRADLDFTRAVATTLTPLGVRVFDHHILAGGRATSLRDEGVL